ncbi:MAG: hypothetical protein M1469_10250 [Bacteroidetes bacterium]|nr:hypothetical protein [Bacteroidota bacterium]
MKTMVGRVYLVLVFVYTTQASAQLQTSPPPVDANGMGGVVASLPSDNAMAPLANPAQTGLFSLHGILSAGAYVPSSSYSNWWGSESMNLSSAELGVNLTNYLRVPFRISVGVGYSRMSSNSLGYPFSRDHERADNAIVSLGLEDIVKIGLGLGLNWISSNYMYQPLQNNESKAASHNYGAIVQIPIAEIIEGGHHATDRSKSTLRPNADFTIAYVMKDMGGYLNNSSLFSRQGNLGINFELGIDSRFDGRSWRLLSVTLAREADEQLIRMDSTVNLFQGDTVYNYFNTYTGAIRHLSPLFNKQRPSPAWFAHVDSSESCRSAV